LKAVFNANMASRRSGSPSTPSEGEIIESGSETKATTSQTSVNGTNVDRRTRTSLSVSPRSAASKSPRLRSRSRTRSRSPYRGPRGEKRRRDDDPDDRRSWHSSRPYGSRRGDRRYDRGYPPRQHRGYHDYDRDDGYGGGLRYNDDYDGRRDKRPRTRSRSPYRDVRKPKQYHPDELDTRRNEPLADHGARRASTEQSVSERGQTPVVAQHMRHEAETREHQVHQDSSRSNSRPVVE
jgi:serine/threonine-protein kinase PRP4